MIDFKQVPKVVVDFMNDDHEEATRVINQLMCLMEAETVDKQQVAELLAQLLAHSQEHFAREEAQMQKIDFPPYPVHKGEHERVLAEMAAELQAWQEAADEKRLNEYLSVTLPEWFVGHIACMDTVTAQFIVRMGGPFECGE